MVQLVTRKQDGDTNPKQMGVWKFRPGSSSTSPPKQRAEGTEAVVTLLLRNRKKEQRGGERRRDNMAAGLPTSDG